MLMGPVPHHTGQALGGREVVFTQHGSIQKTLSAGSGLAVCSQLGNLPQMREGAVCESGGAGQQCNYC